jgi:hypothetical protein
MVSIRQVTLILLQTGDGMDRDHNAEKGRTSVGKTSHTKRISGSESGSGGNASGAGASSLHQYYPKVNPGTSPGKVKYREQGVDELLQLKLHQAIAASDDVPDGSTIILATGDGNMGQFNEEGFLGICHNFRLSNFFFHHSLTRSNKNCTQKRLES